jgi:hypothetical protein
MPACRKLGRRQADVGRYWIWQVVTGAD